MSNILKPDKTTSMNGVTVNEYLLTNHNPNNIEMPYESMEGKIIGISIHNTNRITVSEGTTESEQYTRATYNGNMNDVRVHYYCDEVCAWQNLPLTLCGWHAADGDGDGNRRTIAIECIMGPEYTEKDKKSEDNCARLAASLLKQFNLGADNLYTHKHWYDKKDCPKQILPHWNEFVKKVSEYLETLKKESGKLYRVRKSWEDPGSQTGAFSVLENAKNACQPGYSVFDESGNIVYSAPETEFPKGKKISVNDTVIYAASTDTSGKNKTGTFYIYDGEVINNRMRITSKPEYCGKEPAGTYVTGWINKNDIV